MIVILVMLYKNIPYGTGKVNDLNTKEGKMKDKKTNVWKEPQTLLIGLIVLGMAFAEGSANDWLPITMVDSSSIDSSVGTIIYAVFLGFMFIGRVFGGRLLDIFGRIIILRVSVIIAVIGLTLVIFTSHLFIAVIGVGLWGLVASLGFPVGLSAAGDDPKNAVDRVGAVSIIGYGAFLVGPPILGVLGEQIGLRNAFIVVLILLVIAGLVSHNLKEKKDINA